MTAVDLRADETLDPGKTEPGRRGAAGLALSGWVPFVIALAVSAAVLDYYAVPLSQTAKFAAYTLLGNTLPGLLIWRALRGRAGLLASDVALGTTLGFAVELPVYLVCRFAGEPPAVVAWPIITVVLFAAVPGLRRFWRGSGERIPAGSAWTITLGYFAILLIAALTIFRTQSMNDPQSSAMLVDYPFQFGLLGEFKHQVPLNTPWVTGVPLQYHWYVYAHGAAASWLTGIDPQMMIMRLLPLPMIAAFLTTMVLLVKTLSRRWWAGNLSIVLLLVGLSASPFSWISTPTFNGSITDDLWASPTQTYASVFLVGAMVVLAGILRPRDDEKIRRGWVQWVLYIVLSGATAGAKATFLPMILCGLVFAVVLRLIFRRSIGAELAALGVTFFWFGFAQLVLYGSGTQGTQVDPLQTAKWTPIGEVVMGSPTPVNDLKPLVTITAVGLLTSAFGWAGLAGLLRREWRLDPIMHVMLGFAAAGMGGLWIFAHPGLSQTYFARSATPYLAMLSAIGLASLIPAAKKKLPPIFVRLTVAAAALGVLALLAVQFMIGDERPDKAFKAWSLRHAMLPYAALFAVAAVLAVALLAVGRLSGLRWAHAVAVPVILVLAMAVTTGVHGDQYIPKLLTSGEALREFEPAGARYAIPQDALEAGHWLRDHSNPKDVVATNSHCRLGGSACDSRDFWVAAYSERQVVVEGWSYTEPAFESGGLWDYTLAYSKFWDQPMLAANDAMFYQPTAADIASFSAQHHVKWLVALNNTPSMTKGGALLTVSPDLGKYVTKRFQAGDITIYQLS